MGGGGGGGSGLGCLLVGAYAVRCSSGAGFGCGKFIVARESLQYLGIRETKGLVSVRRW